MKHIKKIFVLGLLLLIFPTTHADQIQNLTANTDNRYINIQWTALSDDIMNNVEGYAVQWSDSKSDIAITKPETVKRWNYNTQNSLPAMLTSTVFDANKYYYVRVYTWTKGGSQNRERFLGNGSQILKFKLNSYRDVITETEYISITDPVISTPTTSSSSDNQDADDILFGKIRVTKYDDHAFFYWSRSNLSSSYAKGRKFIISKNSDLSDPVAEFETSLGTNSVKIMGLEPSEKYYFQGSYYRTEGGEDKLFGSTDTESITMMRPMSAGEKNRIQLLRRRGVMSTPTADVVKTIGEPVVSNTTNTNTDTTTTTNTTSSSSSASTGSSYTRADILAKIRELEAELLTWRNRYKTLTGRTITSNANTQSNTVRTKSQLSLRERLAKLRAK